MKRRQLFLATAFGALSAAACGGGDDPEVRDSLEITGVSPSSVRAGVGTQVEVTFRYSLASTQQGVVDLGFFRDESTQLLTGQRLVVPKGSGTGTLRAVVDPINYTTGASFAVGLLLSEEPHAASWTPLAQAKRFLAVSS